MHGTEIDDRESVSPTFPTRAARVWTAEETELRELWGICGKTGNSLSPSQAILSFMLVNATRRLSSYF